MTSDLLLGETKFFFLSSMLFSRLWCKSATYCNSLVTETCRFPKTVLIRSQVAQSCSDPSWLAYQTSVHGIFQGRVLKWVATAAFSRGSSRPRFPTLLALSWATREACHPDTVPSSKDFVELLCPLLSNSKDCSMPCSCPLTHSNSCLLWHWCSPISFSS